MQNQSCPDSATENKRPRFAKHGPRPQEEDAKTLILSLLAEVDKATLENAPCCSVVALEDNAWHAKGKEKRLTSNWWLWALGAGACWE
mmetsp:Transcript_48110/g.127380  ORF Transcript_48110/g.127380 Transcript_48110/m.127380 type:complete len:88 (-) Transcript_48110:264-527(-)